MGTAVGSETVSRTSNQTPAQAFAKISRRAVLHRMETAECLEDRVYWAIILLSWCGPGVSDFCVAKDHRGFIQRNPAGEPLPAAYVHICSILGLDEQRMKSRISKSITSLTEKGLVRKEAGKIYPVKEPEVSRTCNSKFHVHETFNVAGLVVSTELPEDPERRKSAIAFLVQCQDKFRTRLKELKYEVQNECVRGLLDRGIIIEEEKKSRGEEESSSSHSETGTTTTEEDLSQEEETTPPDPPPPAEPEPDASHLAETLSIDNEAAEMLIKRTRSTRPDATIAEIEAAGVRKLEQLKPAIRSGRVENWVGTLIVAIPKMAQSAVWDVIRDQIRQKRAKPADDPVDERARRVSQLREMWEELSNEDKKLYLELYPEIDTP